ncbi:hypothetical protein D3C84_509680 [compost metagenome]
MKQISFADAKYAGKRKQTRRERFLIEMDQVVPWEGLIALIELHYPKGEGGQPSPVDADLACAPDAELVQLQRSGDGRVALQDHDFAPLCRAEPGAHPG